MSRVELTIAIVKIVLILFALCGGLLLGWALFCAYLVLLEAPGPELRRGLTR